MSFYTENLPEDAHKKVVKATVNRLSKIQSAEDEELREIRLKQKLLAEEEERLFNEYQDYLERRARRDRIERGLGTNYDRQMQQLNEGQGRFN
jgi:hypothetical protein